MLSSIGRVSLLKTQYSSLISNTLCKRFIQYLTVSATYDVSGYVLIKSKNDLSRIQSPVDKTISPLSIKNFSLNNSNTTEKELSAIQFEKISDETLESLTEYFDELIEAATHLPDADVSYGDGVLTVKFGNPYGTYVINRQTPNKQIWLSSPTSGPKRYDFNSGKWIYKHDGKRLHELLNNEISLIVKKQTCFDKCLFSGKERHTAVNNV